MHRTSTKILIAFLLISGLSFPLFAQTLTLAGTVKDPMGEPLIGATVQWKEDPSKGTQTDKDGKFELVVTEKS